MINQLPDSFMEVAAATGSCNDPVEALEMGADAFRSALGGEAVSVFSIDGKAQVCRCLTTDGFPWSQGDHLTAQDLTLFRELAAAGWLQSGKTANCFKGEVSGMSVACLPLLVAGTLVGMLCVGGAGLANVDAPFLAKSSQQMLGLISLLTLCSSLSTHDAQTGVCNRTHFIECVNREIARALRSAGSFSVILIRVQSGSNDNRTDNSFRADELKAIAVVLKERLRQTDSIGRIAEHALACLLPDTSRFQCKAALARIKEVINQHCPKENRYHSQLTDNIEASGRCYPEDGDTIEKLLMQT